VKFVFKYRSGRDWMTEKSVTKDFPDASYAEAFADGLQKGGAGKISVETNQPKQYLCVVCKEIPVNPHEGFDTCPDCVSKV